MNDRDKSILTLCVFRGFGADLVLTDVETKLKPLPFLSF